MINEPKRLFEKQIDDALRAEVEYILKESNEIILNSPVKSLNTAVEIYNMIEAR